MAQSSENDIIDTLYTEISSGLTEDSIISPIEVIDRLKTSMKTVEKIKDIKGDVKKKLVLATIQKIVEVYVPEEHKIWFEPALEFLLPPIIDLVINVDKRKETITVITNTWDKTKKMCCPCIH